VLACAQLALLFVIRLATRKPHMLGRKVSLQSSQNSPRSLPSGSHSSLLAPCHPRPLDLGSEIPIRKILRRCSPLPSTLHLAWESRAASHTYHTYTHAVQCISKARGYMRGTGLSQHSSERAKKGELSIY